jgi:hypothetical protein
VIKIENYQYEDFFISVRDEDKDFVTTIHERLLQEGCEVKIGSSKTNLFSVKYTQGRKGVFNFMLRKRGFKASVYAANFAQYPNVLDDLPEIMIKQIDETQDCKNITDPGKCMGNCLGYDIQIRAKQYQKCKFSCFQFDVDEASKPALLKMLESELEVRAHK